MKKNKEDLVSTLMHHVSIVGDPLYFESYTKDVKYKLEEIIDKMFDMIPDEKKEELYHLCEELVELEDDPIRI